MNRSLKDLIKDFDLDVKYNPEKYNPFDELSNDLNLYYRLLKVHLYENGVMNSPGDLLEELNHSILVVNVFENKSGYPFAEWDAFYEPEEMCTILFDIATYNLDASPWIVFDESYLDTFFEKLKMLIESIRNEKNVYGN